jgi:hypothetical protein
MSSGTQNQGDGLAACRECLKHAAKVATETGEAITDGKAGVRPDADAGAYYVASMLRALARRAPESTARQQATEAERTRIVAGIREVANGIDVRWSTGAAAWRALFDAADMIEAGKGPFAALAPAEPPKERT